MGIFRRFFQKDDSAGNERHVLISLVSKWQYEVAQLELEVIEARLNGLSRVDIALRQGQIEGYTRLLSIIFPVPEITAPKQTLLRLNEQLPEIFMDAVRRRKIYNQSYAKGSPPEEVAHAEGVLRSTRQASKDLKQLTSQE